MKLQIEPLVGLCDKKISISVSDLPPLRKVKISASMSLPWAEQMKFHSHAWFTADEQGTVDLATQRPDSGDYDTIDPMGLIVSLKLFLGKIEDIVKKISVEKSMHIEMVAECENDRESKTLERLFKSPEVQREKIVEEFVGELFYMPAASRKSNTTIVVLGGSDGNSSALALISALLASHGFNVLSLSYFNEKGLPQKLAEVPLEYFEKVFQWLEKHPITCGSELYVHGTSKGGELALLLASRYPRIKKVVAFAPHAYCFQGLNHKNVPSWTYGGGNIPFIRIKNSIVLKDMITAFLKNQPFGYAHSYRTALETASNKEEARIPIENAKADLLLFSGKEDNIWNAGDGCSEIINTLQDQDYQYDYKHVSYENAGHPFPLPYMIPVSVLQSMKVAPRLVFVHGGTLEGNAQVQSDSWLKTIAFFNQEGLNSIYRQQILR